MSLDLEKMNISRPELFDFHGVSMTHYFTDNWENVQNFEARPDDILIATYPKAGTTWVSYMLDLLYFGQTCLERQASVPIYERVPFLEIFIPTHLESGKDLADKLPTTPRLIKTHLPVQFVPKSFWEQNSRIVYVARNAKDNMVSYYHFDNMNMVEPEAGEWSSFFQRFMEGKMKILETNNEPKLLYEQNSDLFSSILFNHVPLVYKMVFGSWYDHVNGWWKKKQTHSNIHYMFFEDLVEDTGREMDKLCSFLGSSTTSDVKEKVLTGVQFNNMKKNQMANYSTLPVMDFKVSPFMRKGKVGDWKNHFTVAQNEAFDEDYRKKMKDSPLKFRNEI